MLIRKVILYATRINFLFVFIKVMGLKVMQNRTMNQYLVFTLNFSFYWNGVENYKNKKFH